MIGSLSRNSDMWRMASPPPLYPTTADINEAGDGGICKQKPSHASRLFFG